MRAAKSLKQNPEPVKTDGVILFANAATVEFHQTVKGSVATSAPENTECSPHRSIYDNWSLSEMAVTAPSAASIVALQMYVSTNYAWYIRGFPFPPGDLLIGSGRNLHSNAFSKACAMLGFDSTLPSTFVPVSGGCGPSGKRTISSLLLTEVENAIWKTCVRYA